MCFFLFSCEKVFNKEDVVGLALEDAERTFPTQRRLGATISIENAAQNEIAFVKVNRANMRLAVMRVHSTLTFLPRTVGDVPVHIGERSFELLNVDEFAQLDLFDTMDGLDFLILPNDSRHTTSTEPLDHGQYASVK